MFGTNPIRKQELLDGQTLATESVFYTIQGEGPLAGTPAVFVRLAGCWLACTFCDTQFETGINNRLSLKELLDKVFTLSSPAHTCDLVVLTGGDPLRQNIVPLCRALVEGHYHVQIETAGIAWVPELEELITQPLESYGALKSGVSIVVSPKTGKVHEKVRQLAFAWKYIIRSEDRISEFDGMPMMSTQVDGQHQMLARPPTFTPSHSIFVQPCDEYKPLGEITAEARNKANERRAVEIAMRYGYRLSLQVHKHLGLE